MQHGEESKHRNLNTQPGRPASALRHQNPHICSVLALITVLVGIAPVHAATGPKGAARHWEAALRAGEFSSVNLRTGRMLTTVPIMSYGGRGPRTSFALFNNQVSDWGPPGALMGDINQDGMIDDADIEPFIDLILHNNWTGEELELADYNGDAAITIDDLYVEMDTIVNTATAPDWRTSYSSKLIVEDGGTTVRLIRDDGTEDLFTINGSGPTYAAPPGIWDTLRMDGDGNGFTLASKQQRKSHYKRVSQMSAGQYRLDWIADASAALDNQGLPYNRVICSYNPYDGHAWDGKLAFVTDAPGRTLSLFYSATTGKLTSILDPAHPEWQLLYQDTANPPGQPGKDKAGPLVVVKDPMGFNITITYTSDNKWDIASLADKDNHAYTFTYANGRLWTITDPAPFAGQTQQFVYFNLADYASEWITDYIDRGLHHWTVTFPSDGENLLAVEDPFNHARNLSYADPRPQLVHEPTSYTWGGQVWSAYYNAVGNVVHVTDPLQHRTLYDYDSLNNLIGVTPPGTEALSPNTNKKVTLVYGDALHPTKPTEIHEPKATTATGEPEPVTTVEYFHTNDAPNSNNWNGLPKFITTPGAAGKQMVVSYWYDQYGQQSNMWEGAPITQSIVETSPPPGGWAINSGPTGDPGGGSDPTGASSSMDTDDDGRVTRVRCYPPPAALLTTPSDVCFAPGAPNCLKRPGVPSGWINSGCTYCSSGCANGDIMYNNMGQPTSYAKCDGDDFSDGILASHRSFSTAYDQLGRLKTSSITDSEGMGAYNSCTGQWIPVFPLTRTFNYDYQQAASGIYKRTGPDGDVTTTTLDYAWRLQSYVRANTQNVVVMSATMTYYDDDRVQTVTYGNGASITYIYDPAGRVVDIQHFASGGSLFKLLHYFWSADGLVNRITETGSVAASTQFTYDNRNRLIDERRTGDNPYHLHYSYDLAGNRKTKAEGQDDENGGPVTTYTYDVDDVATYGTRSNRLMYSYKSWAFQQNSAEERWYHYDAAGRVDYVVRRRDMDVDGTTAQQWYRGTELWYNSPGQIWMSRSVKWRLDGSGGVTNKSYLTAMEYRYDSPRQRYAVRPRSANSLAMDIYGGQSSPHRDYDGDEVYGEYSVTALEWGWSWNNCGVQGPSSIVLSATEQRAIESGLADAERGTNGSVTDRNYYHSNLIGTTDSVTGSTGASSGRMVFTAFGEPVYSSLQPTASSLSRYGYAGAWGYEAPSGSLCTINGEQVFCDPLTDLGWLHVGARYYDPASGRFVQRDPLGIEGGLNVYSYGDANPLDGVDPEGMSWWRDLGRGAWDLGARAISVVRRVALNMTGCKAPVSIGVVAPVAKGLEAGPDCMRIYCAEKHLQNSLQGTDINEDMDKWEKGHGKWVKPGSGQ